MSAAKKPAAPAEAKNPIGESVNRLEEVAILIGAAVGESLAGNNPAKVQGLLAVAERIVRAVMERLDSEAVRK